MLFDTISYVAGADHLYDIAGSTLSTPSDSDVVVRFEAVRAFKIPANFAGTEVNLGTLPASNAVLTVKKNGTGLTNGTIQVASGGGVTLGSVAETSYAVGDLLEIEFTTVDSSDELAVTLKTLAA